MKKFFFLIFLLTAFVFANGYGIATLVKGSVQVLTSDGKNKILKRGDKVFETDTIVTASKSVVRVVMIDTNIIDVYPNSKLFIKQYVYSPQEDNKNVRLEVAAGQIKSTVKQKYDNEKNKYNVKTPAIVAGVRGTIFTTEHEIQTGTSRVFTHEGNVLVGRIDAQENVKEFFSVKANQKIQIDRTIEKPQVIDTPKIEIQKQQTIDKEDGFVKVDRNSRNNLSDTARPAIAGDSPERKNVEGIKNSENNRVENRKEPVGGDSENKDGGKTEVKEPVRNESGGGRQSPDSSKREEEQPKREVVSPRPQPDSESGRPDSEESKKEIKKRLQEELKRLKREQAKRSRKER